MKKPLIFLVMLVTLATVFLWWHYAESPGVVESTQFENGATTTLSVPAVASPAAPYTLSDTAVATSSYVRLVDTPQLTVATGTYSCVGAGTTTRQMGQTREVVLNSKTVCATEVAEGAAGSVYHQYAYVTAAPTGELLQYTFTVREVQCMNYDEPQASECVAEQADFNPDTIAAMLIMNTKQTGA